VAVRVAAALTLTALALSYAVDALGVDLLVERQDKEADAAAAMELPEGLVLASPWVLGALAAAALARSVSRRLHKVSPSPAADKVADCCAASTCGGATPEDKAAKEAKLGTGTEELVSRQERIDALKTMRDLVNEKASETGMSKEEAFQALRAEMERDADYVHVPRPDAAEGKF
jgi:hypothetical protein